MNKKVCVLQLKNREVDGWNNATCWKRLSSNRKILQVFFWPTLTLKFSVTEINLDSNQTQRVLCWSIHLTLQLSLTFLNRKPKLQENSPGPETAVHQEPLMIDFSDKNNPQKPLKSRTPNVPAYVTQGKLWVLLSFFVHALKAQIHRIKEMSQSPETLLSSTWHCFSSSYVIWIFNACKTVHMFQSLPHNCCGESFLRVSLT